MGLNLFGAGLIYWSNNMIDYEYPEHFDIKYKIIEIDEQNQLMVVRYWTDWLTEEELAVDSNKRTDGTPVRCRTDYSINIWDHMKTEEDIENVLTNNIPVDWFKLQYVIRAPDIDHTINGRLSHIKKIQNLSFNKKIPLKDITKITTNNDESDKTETNKTEETNKNSEVVLKKITEKIQKVKTLNENELDELLELLVEK